jgi:hypothetical protein
MTFFYAGLYWAAMFALKAPMPGMFRMYLLASAALVLLFLITFDMLVVRSSTDGRRTMPDWPDFSNWGEIIVIGLKGWAIWIALHLPIFLFNAWLFSGTLAMLAAEGPKALAGLGVLFVVGNLLLLVAAFVFYPMCFALVSNYQVIRLALHPRAVLGSIGRILPEYMVFLALYLALTLTAKAVTFVFWLVLPLGAGVVGALLHSVSRLTGMHMLGLMIYQGAHKLGWDD